MDPVAADRGLLETLEALDVAENYRAWILMLAAPHLADGDHVLEVGAGHGTFTTELARSGRVTAIEIGQEALLHLQERFSGRPEVVVADSRLEELPAGGFDAAFLSNVLEHIEDDVAALRELARVVRPGGSVIVFSPAFEVLYSDFDASIGHHHRYRRPVLAARFEEAGLEVVEDRYVNAVGFFSWLFLVRLLGMTPANTRLVRLFDRRFVPVLRRIEARFAPPFGQSVLVVGRVPSVE